MLYSPEVLNTLKGKTVLVVDDENAIREIVATHFTTCNAFVRQACSGDEAIRILEEGEIDLIVSDIRMPNGDGIALLDAVRAMQGPPMILISAASDFTPAMAMKRGAHAMLYKPFRTRELLEAAAQAVNETSQNVGLGATQREYAIAK